MNFKEYIKRLVGLISREEEAVEMISFQTMDKRDLKKIVLNGGELRKILGPAFAEYDYYLLEKISRNPNMTLGELRDSMNMRFDLLIDAAGVELKNRGKLTDREQIELDKINNQL